MRFAPIVMHNRSKPVELLSSHKQDSPLSDSRIVISKMAAGLAGILRLLRQPHLTMINSSHLFLLLTIITGALGFAALHGAIALISQVLFFAFFVLMITSVIHHEIQRREP